MPVAGATKRNLPVELYRSIAESLVKEGDRRFEFKPASYASVKLLLTVSKSFQVEAERLIWRVVCLESHHDGDIILLCDHILSIPRVWPYIKCFRLVNRDRFQYGIKAKFGINPPHPQTVDFLASLLRKLANLVFLEMTLGLWKSGSLLKNMPFRLRIFLLDCALDDDMLLFLNQQPSITEWRVDFEESQLADLPTTTLPNLAVINIPFGNETVVKGRPITHVYARTAASLRTLTLSTMPLKTLVVDFVVNTPILETITELFPALESFSPLDCTAANKAFILTSFVPKFLQLHTLVISTEEPETETALALKAACPSIRRIFDSYVGYVCLWNNTSTTHTVKVGIDEPVWGNLAVESHPPSYRFYRWGR